MAEHVESLLHVEHLRQTFVTGHGAGKRIVHAVDDVICHGHDFLPVSSALPPRPFRPKTGIHGNISPP